MGWSCEKKKLAKRADTRKLEGETIKGCGEDRNCDGDCIKRVIERVCVTVKGSFANG